MNRSLQQAFDFLDESNAVYELLSSLSDKEFNQPTQFKGWSFNDVIGHLHVWNYAADISLSDGEDWVEFSNKALKALGSGSTMNQFERTITNNIKGKELLEVWKNYFTEMSDRFASADPKKRVKWMGPDMSVRSLRNIPNQLNKLFLSSKRNLQDINLDDKACFQAQFQ